MTVPALERLVHTAFPRARLLQAQPLANGLRNSNFKVQLDAVSECIVVRIYEHDASLCQKEVDLIHLVAGSVPAAEVIHAEPAGLADLPPFALLRYVEGITFRDLNGAPTTTQSLRRPTPRAKRWLPLLGLPFPHLDGSVRGQASLRLCWKEKIRYRVLSTYASNLRTRGFGCPQGCATGYIASYGRGRRSSRN